MSLESLDLFLREAMLRRAKGRCECRGQCGRHSGRCGEFFGQAGLLGGETKPHLGKRVVGKVSKPSHASLVCEDCLKTYQGIPVKSRERDARTDYSHYTKGLSKR